jgi:hypothetical protein
VFDITPRRPTLRCPPSWENSAPIAAFLIILGVKLPDGEIRHPTLYDISGSAHWYNAADHGIIVSSETTTNVREIAIEKSRYRGAGVPGSGWFDDWPYSSAVVSTIHPQRGGQRNGREV